LYTKTCEVKAKTGQYWQTSAWNNGKETLTDRHLHLDKVLDAWLTVLITHHSVSDFLFPANQHMTMLLCRSRAKLAIM